MPELSGSPDPIQPEDLEVTLAVRRDLGPGQDQAVINEFLDRVGAAIDARVEARVAARLGAEDHARTPTTGPRRGQAPIGLALGTIALGFLTTSITLPCTHGSVGGVLATAAAWIAIAMIFLATMRRL
jgi:hypothetical protein